MKGFFKEFKEFAMRGNVIDLAVGVIIGGAFQKIINSLVKTVKEEKEKNKSIIVMIFFAVFGT